MEIKIIGNQNPQGAKPKKTIISQRPKREHRGKLAEEDRLFGLQNDTLGLQTEC